MTLVCRALLKKRKGIKVKICQKWSAEFAEASIHYCPPILPFDVISYHFVSMRRNSQERLRTTINFELELSYGEIAEEKTGLGSGEGFGRGKSGNTV